MGWAGKIFARRGRGDSEPRATREPRYRVDPPEFSSTITWKGLTTLLGPPPYGPAGTSANPAGGVYGESNPNSRAAALRDEQTFFEKTGRKPSAEEGRMIEQRWLGWGYE